jgi:hypothetical protein
VRNCALVALVACLPVAVLATPAVAEPAIQLISHPQDDWAGAQIAIHEGAATQDEPVPIGLTGPSQVATAAPPPSGLDVSSYQAT